VCLLAKITANCDDKNAIGVYGDGLAQRHRCYPDPGTTPLPFLIFGEKRGG